MKIDSLMMKKKIIRTATIPSSLKTLLNGNIEHMMEKYELVLVSSPGAELDWMNKYYGMKTIGVPMERHISFIKDIMSLIKLINVFRKEEPYMVHSMTPKAGLLCMLAAWICRVPRRVHTFTGLVWPTAVGCKRMILLLADKIICACATHIIPEGEGVKHDLQNHVTKKPMKVLGYGNVRGVDMQYWQRPKTSKDSNWEQTVAELRDLFWLTPHEKSDRLYVFIFVGRIVSDKGVNELVDAFVRLREHFLKLDNGQKIRLLLIGPTEDALDPLLQITWDRIKSTPSIIEVGPLWGDVLLKYYAASDCFVLPSYREGFPNVVLEAGAMELPSIVTDINGSREIIIEGENGVIIPSKNVVALYEAMLNMVENNEARMRMAKNARPMIESRFEQTFVRKCLFDFYDEIM